MIPVNIDTSVCTACGLCVEVCPYRALSLKNGKATYILDDCFSCGHCMAVCPEEAITLPGLQNSLDCPVFEKPEAVGVNDASMCKRFMQLMASRRSCRNFKDKEVPLEVLQGLVQIGITAPSGTNCQPWNFIILPSRDDLFIFGELVGNYFKKLNRMAESRLLRCFTGLFTGGALTRYYQNHYSSIKEALHDWEVNGEDRLFHEAKAAILVTTKKNASCPVEDAMLATQNILLAAHSLRLGTCLIGFAVEAVRRDKSLREKLAIPDDEELCSVIVTGYPRISYLRPAGRKKVVPKIFRFAKEV